MQDGQAGDLSPLSDAALLAAAAAGERAAFDRFAQRHRPAIVRFVRHSCHADDGEDVAQEALVIAHRVAASFRGEGSARAWLFQIARRLALKRHTRRDAVADSPLVELAAQAGWGDPPRSPEDAASEAETRAQLRAAFARLAPEDREVLHLRDIEGLTGPEAAEALDLHLDALKTRLHRARLRLMALLRQGDGERDAGHEAGRGGSHAG